MREQLTSPGLQGDLEMYRFARHGSELPIDGNLSFGAEYKSAIEIDQMLKALKGPFATWRKLKSLDVLDIGCGSVGSVIDGKFNGELRPREFAPYFSRMCAAGGAKVVGLDINPAGTEDNQLYTHLKVDLIPRVIGEGLQQWEPLQGKNFDLIHCSDLVEIDSSPTLRLLLNFNKRSLEEFELVLFAQLGELLAERGVLMIDRSIPDTTGKLYKKKQGQMREI